MSEPTITDADWRAVSEAVKHAIIDNIYQPLVKEFARHRIASVRATAMSDLIAGDADLYDAPSDDLVERVARAIWEQQCQHWGHYRDKVPDLCEWDDLTQSKKRELLREALAAIAVTRSQVEREIVAWLRACSLSSAMPDDPAQMIADLADAIEQGQHRSEG